MCQSCKALSDAIDRYIAKADNNLKTLLNSEGYYDADTTLEYINAMEAGFAEALTAETQHFVMLAEKAVDLRAFAGEYWEKAKANDGLAAKLYRIFTEQMQTFIPYYVEGYIQRVDAELRLTRVSQRTLAWVDSWGKQLGDLMQLNSHEEMEAILKEGLENGSSIPEFARKIQESGIRDEYYKARRAALTEVLRAHSVAAQEAQMQSPAVDTKTWRHTGPKNIKPRPNHVEMNGQTVPKDKPYELIGADGELYYPMYPRDINLPGKESINCHCLSQGNVSEEVLGLPLETRQALQEKAIEEMDADWFREADEASRARADAWRAAKLAADMD